MEAVLVKYFPIEGIINSLPLKLAIIKVSLMPRFLATDLEYQKIQRTVVLKAVSLFEII
jgi:hypothetical protein